MIRKILSPIKRILELLPNMNKMVKIERYEWTEIDRDKDGIRWIWMKRNRWYDRCAWMDRNQGCEWIDIDRYEWIEIDGCDWREINGYEWIEIDGYNLEYNGYE